MSINAVYIHIITDPISLISFILNEVSATKNKFTAKPMFMTIIDIHIVHIFFTSII